jgi:hypothetical protein
MKPRLGKLKNITTTVGWIGTLRRTELKFKRRRKTTLAVRNARPPPHHKPVTTLHRQLDDRVIRTKTPSSPLASSFPTLCHTEVASCRARLTAVVRCKPQLPLVLAKPTPSIEIQVRTPQFPNRPVEWPVLLGRNRQFLSLEPYLRVSYLIRLRNCYLNFSYLN